MKVLPRAPWETEREAYIDTPKLRSRRFPTKVMYMGVVGRPIEGRCDGKVFLQRVATTKTTNRSSFNQHFFKSGDWKKLLVEDDLDDVLCEEVFNLIGEYYDLDENVTSNLSFAYDSHPSTGRSKKVEQFDSGFLLDDRVYVDSCGIRHPVCLDQLKLLKHVPKGSVTQVDATCDSSFMLSQVHRIGRAIREKYDWVPLSKPIYLVLDNAGGHGTTDAKKTFMRTLRRKYNVVCKWQVPNSPDTNMLDLGAWATIQSQVEECHRKRVMRNDVLAESVEYAFYHMLDSEKLLNVYNRWRKVLHLVLKSCGGNELVEGCRGTADVDDVEELDLGSDNEREVAVDENAGLVDVETDVDDYSDTDTESDDDDYGNLDMISLSTDDDSTGYHTDEEVATVLTAMTENMDDDSTVTEYSTENYLDMELLGGRDENDDLVNHGDDFDNDTHVIIEESDDTSTIKTA